MPKKKRWSKLYLNHTIAQSHQTACVTVNIYLDPTVFKLRCESAKNDKSKFVIEFYQMNQLLKKYLKLAYFVKMFLWKGNNLIKLTHLKREKNRFF